MGRWRPSVKLEYSSASQSAQSVCLNFVEVGQFNQGRLGLVETPRTLTNQISGMTFEGVQFSLRHSRHETAIITLHQQIGLRRNIHSLAVQLKLPVL